SDTIQVTTSRDVLAAMARGEGPLDAFIALGYAGWESGQLEREIRDNAWLSMPVDSRVVFELPFEDRWLGAWRLLGIDVERLSLVAGHAGGDGQTTAHRARFRFWTQTNRTRRR